MLVISFITKLQNAIPISTTFEKNRFFTEPFLTSAGAAKPLIGNHFKIRGMKKDSPSKIRNHKA
jgi:hypothetical protein